MKELFLCIRKWIMILFVPIPLFIGIVYFVSMEAERALYFLLFISLLLGVVDYLIMRCPKR